MSRRQHHRGKKRPKHWHRGHNEARQWKRTELPDLGTGADPTSGAPRPLRRKQSGGRVHGDSI